MITLDEAIKHCEEVAKELQEVDMAELDLMYAGDTECIDEHKDRCLACANDHKQLAEWLTDYKRLKEQEPSEDCVSRQAVTDAVENTIAKYIPILIGRYERIPLELAITIKDLPPVTPTRKKGEWIKKNNDYFDWYECSECGYGSDGEMKYNRLCDVRTKFCPDCGSQNLKGE